jgi:hypothetical protein
MLEDMRPFVATITSPPTMATTPKGDTMLKVLNGPTIAAGESLSDAIDCSAGQLVAITMPEGWSDAQGNKGASLTFQYSPDGQTYSELCSIDGFAVTVPQVVPGSTVVVSADVGRATAWLKLRSGSAGNPVAQEEARTFALSIMTTAAAPTTEKTSWSGEEFRMPAPKKKAPAKKPTKKPVKKKTK